MFTLRPYQDESIEKLKRGWLATHGTNFHKNQLLVLATGLGKTVVFSNIADWIYNDFTNGHVLILAHREELLEQAEDKLKRVMGLDDFRAYHLIQREQGSNYAQEAPIISASVPTWGVNRGSGEWNERMSRFPRDYFKLIIVDEAHHATAASYRHILDYFESAWVLGVTATPKRGDKQSLKKVFSRTAYKMDIVDGMRGGYLCPVVSHRVSSRTDLSRVRTTAGDFNLKDLAKTVNNVDRNNLIVESYKDQCRAIGVERQCVVFATDLEHARALREDFNHAGIRCETISGDMPKDERRQFIKDFKEKRIKVLTNYGVLTEGFDYEELDLIVSARPTKSALLLTQILGRGTRWPKEIMPDKLLDFIEIIDLHSDETATAAAIFGFHQKFDCEGFDFLHCIELAEDMEKKKDYYSPWSALSFSRMVQDFERAMPTRGPNATNSNNWFFDNRYRFIVTSGNNLILKHRDTEEDKNYVVRVTESPLGGYEGTISERVDRTERRLYIFDGDTRLDVVQKLESTLQKNWPKWDVLLNVNARWRQKAQGEPCTDKQWALIQKMNLARGAPRQSISKGKAMDMISRAFNR